MATYTSVFVRGGPINNVAGVIIDSRKCWLAVVAELLELVTTLREFVARVQERYKTLEMLLWARILAEIS